IRMWFTRVTLCCGSSGATTTRSIPARLMSMFAGFARRSKTIRVNPGASKRCGVLGIDLSRNLPPLSEPAAGSPPAAPSEQSATSWRHRLLRFAPATLAGRLAWTYALVVIVVIAILGQYLSSTARDFYISGLQTDLQHESFLISEIMTRELATGNADLDALAKSLGDQIDARITFVAPDGTVL